VECVPIARLVAQHQRRRSGLSGRVALGDPRIEVVRPRGRLFEPGRPVPGDREQVRPERRSQFVHGRWQRAREVPVLPLPEAMAGHVDGRAEPLDLVVERPEVPALVRVENGPGGGDAEVVEGADCATPVELVDAPSERSDRGARWCHAAASSSRRVALASEPPRYPPMLPSDLTTRWQGTTTGSGFVAHAEPTARTALGRPAIWATVA
jgi:hypothetical protein